MLQYLLSHGGCNKLIVVENKANFEKKCRLVFYIGDKTPITVELYVKEFDMYAELTDIVSELPDGGRLRLVRNSVAAARFYSVPGWHQNRTRLAVSGCVPTTVPYRSR